MKCSCKVNVKEAEKKPELHLDKTDFQADAGRPFSIEIPYKSKTIQIDLNFNLSITLFV